MEEDRREDGEPRPRLERRTTQRTNPGATITICQQLPQVLERGDGEKGGPLEKRRRLLEHGDPMVGDEDRGDQDQGLESSYGSDADVEEEVPGRATERAELFQWGANLQEASSGVVGRETFTLQCDEELSDSCDAYTWPDTTELADWLEEDAGWGGGCSRREGLLVQGAVSEPHFVPASTLITPAEQTAFRDWLENGSSIPPCDLFGPGESQ